MSFDYNPLKHIEIVEKDDSINVELYCHSCGAEMGNYDRTTPVNVFFNDMQIHIIVSHRRTEKDFEGWSKL